MIDLSVFQKGWALRNRREQRGAGFTLIITILSVFVFATIVGSIMLFLTVLAGPSRIQTIDTLAWLYEKSEFTGNYSFLVFLGIASFVALVISRHVLVLKAYANLIVFEEATSAQRLSTVRICDRIIDRLVDFHPLDALMKNCLQFQRFVKQAQAA